MTEDETNKISRAEATYVINTKSMRFHLLDCRYSKEPLSTNCEYTNLTFDELLALEYARDEIVPFPVDYAHLFAPGYVVFIEYACMGCDVYADMGIYSHRHHDTGISLSYSHDDCRGEVSFTELIEKYLAD